MNKLCISCQDQMFEGTIIYPPCIQGAWESAGIELYTYAGTDVMRAAITRGDGSQSKKEYRRNDQYRC
jgi:hypothetical protein